MKNYLLDNKLSVTEKEENGEKIILWADEQMSIEYRTKETSLESIEAFKVERLSPEISKDPDHDTLGAVTDSFKVKQFEYNSGLKEYKIDGETVNQTDYISSLRDYYIANGLKTESLEIPMSIEEASISSEIAKNIAEEIRDGLKDIRVAHYDTPTIEDTSEQSKEAQLETPEVSETKDTEAEPTAKSISEEIETQIENKLLKVREKEELAKLRRDERFQRKLEKDRQKAELESKYPRGSRTAGIFTIGLGMGLALVAIGSPVGGVIALATTAIATAGSAAAELKFSSEASKTKAEQTKSEEKELASNIKKDREGRKKVEAREKKLEHKHPLDKKLAKTEVAHNEKPLTSKTPSITPDAVRGIYDEEPAIQDEEPAVNPETTVATADPTLDLVDPLEQVEDNMQPEEEGASENIKEPEDVMEAKEEPTFVDISDTDPTAALISAFNRQQSNEIAENIEELDDPEVDMEIEDETEELERFNSMDDDLSL